MKNNKQGLQHELYLLQTQPLQQSDPYFTLLFSESYSGIWQELSEQQRPLRLVYELDAKVLPTVLERYSMQHIFRQFTAANHTINVIVYDHTWYDKTDLTSVTMNNFVASLKAISPRVTIFAASELRKTIDVGALYTSLEKFMLKDLIGSGKGVEKKNSSQSIQNIMRRGLSLAIWQWCKADIVLSRGSMTVKPQISMAFLEVPALPDVHNSGNTQVIKTESRLLFEAVMSIRDENLLDVYHYMVVTNDVCHANLQAFFAAQPLETKKQLATVIVSVLLGSLEEGIKVRQGFDAAIIGKSLDDYLPVTWLPAMTLFDAVASLNLYSRSELRRLFASGSVRNIANPNQPLQPDYQAIKHNDVIRVGKKYRIRMCIQ